MTLGRFLIFSSREYQPTLSRSLDGTRCAASLLAVDVCEPDRYRPNHLRPNRDWYFIPERMVSQYQRTYLLIAVDLSNPESIILNSRLCVPGLSMCVNQIDIAPTTCVPTEIGILYQREWCLNTREIICLLSLIQPNLSLSSSIRGHLYQGCRCVWTRSISPPPPASGASQVPLQGYLAYKKTHPPRTLPKVYA